MTRILVKHTSINVDVNRSCFQGFSPLIAASMAGFRFCVKVDIQEMNNLVSNGHRKGLVVQQEPEPEGQVAGPDSRVNSRE